MSYFYRRSLIEKAGKGNPWKDAGGKFSGEGEDEDGKPYHFTGEEKADARVYKDALKAAVGRGERISGDGPITWDQVYKFLGPGLIDAMLLSPNQKRYLTEKYSTYVKRYDAAGQKKAKSPKPVDAQKAKDAEKLKQVFEDKGPPKLVPKGKYKTNGEMTADIMAAAKKYPGHPLEVAEFARKLMDKFPLSSKKILYDEDLNKLEATMKEALLKAAIASDKAKFEALQPGNQEGYLQTEKGTPGFGRYDAPKPEKAAPVKLFDSGQEALMDKAIGALELAEKRSDLTKASKALASLAKKIGDKHPMYSKVTSISGWLAGRGQIGWNEKVSEYANSALNGLLEEMAKLEKGKK
jgi:hypothetical protein